MEGKEAGPPLIPTIRVGVRELRGNLTRYLGEVRRGTCILVTSRNTVVAEIRTPATEPSSPRRPGALKGKIRIAEDFDAWPTDILDTFGS